MGGGGGGMEGKGGGIERKRKVSGGGHIRQKQLHVHLVYHAIIKCIIH